MSDDQRNYRTAEEIAIETAKDPIVKFRKYILDRKILFWKSTSPIPFFFGVNRNNEIYFRHSYGFFLRIFLKFG